MSNPAYESEIFRLVVTAGFYHPNNKTRELLRSLLDEWLESLCPCHSAEAVIEALSHEQGTFLEPFTLSTEDLECAAFLTRTAFSKATTQERFRIVSRDTIGTSGGLVFTRKLQSYFVERFPEGRGKGQPKQAWTFIPTLVPTRGRTDALPAVAELLSEDAGLRILVRMPEESKDPAGLGRAFQKSSKIEGIPEDFSRLGLRVEIRHNEVHVITGSPESMIRIMAHMAAKTTLVLQTGNTKDYCALVRLEPPEEDSVPLKAVIGAREGFTNWMRAHPPLPLVLDGEHKLAVCDWLPSPREWLDFTLKNLP